MSIILNGVSHYHHGRSAHPRPNELRPGQERVELMTGGRGWITHTGPIEDAYYYKPNDWNTLVIHARGDRVAVHVNGVKTAESREDPGPRIGKIALQLNSRQNDVHMEYRNLRILQAR